MERVRVAICGKDYNLVTDDAPTVIRKIAERLERKIGEFDALKTRSDEERLTLIALNIMNEGEKDMAAIKKVIGELHKKVSSLEREIVRLKESDGGALSENLRSATMELEQIARVRDEENELLRQKLSEYERYVERLSKEREAELKRLRDGFDSASGEMASIAGFRDAENEQLRQKLSEYEQYVERLVKERETEIKRLHDGFDGARRELEQVTRVKAGENDKLRSTLSTYEATFDNYVKLKEEEVVRLRSQLERSELERGTLERKLSAAENPEDKSEQLELS